MTSWLGEQATGSGLPDVLWLRPDGEQMTDEDWRRQDALALGVFLNGHAIPNHDRNGDPIDGCLIPAPIQRQPRTDHICRPENARARLDARTLDRSRQPAVAAQTTRKPAGSPKIDRRAATRLSSYGALAPVYKFDPVGVSGSNNGG